ncbi:unnamed protein product [Toxocara canis]|nr:unnamed protein product [Toxocara canis]
MHLYDRAMLIPLLLSLSSLLTFLSGISLAVVDVGFPELIVALLGTGLFGLCVSAIVWALRPKSLMAWPKCIIRKIRRTPLGSARYAKAAQAETLNPDNTEVVMRSIRGIPYLIQAIQYSMETTYYTDMMSQMGEGVVRTSVIHTAPGCTSVLDSDNEGEAETRPSLTPIPIGPDELWTPTGSSTWKNSQLRLSLNRASSSLNVFPYAEANPPPDSFDVDSALDLDDNSVHSPLTDEGDEADQR